MEPAIYQMLCAHADFWEKRIPDKGSSNGEGPDESTCGMLEEQP